MSVVWKLVTLIAVLLMPFGMTAAPAAATPHHSASMPMEHCPDESMPDAKGGIAQCTMACAAALPAVDSGAGEALTICRTPELPRAPHRLRGLHPDTATPPPKAS